MGEKIRLSTTRIETFLSCRMLYKWIYIEGLVPKKKPTPLQVGDFVHRLLHKHATGSLKDEDFQNLDKAVQEVCPENTPEESQEVAKQAVKLVQGYVKHWQDDPLTHLASEVHIETEEPDFFLYARVDGLCRTKDQRLWRLEHKTTSRIDSAFLAGLKGGLQTGISHYVLSKVLKERVHGTIFNLLVKTQTPQYERSFIPYRQRQIDLCLETVRGVARSIEQGNIYPSMRCFGWNRECEYSALCNFDSLEVREKFFQKKEIQHENCSS